MEQLIITTALTTITTTSRSLFNRYSITIFGLNSDGANCLTRQFVDRFNLVKCEGEVTMAA